jgi:dihydroxyacetone kinase
MLDALLPAAEAIQEAVNSGQSMSYTLRAAAAAAAAGARATTDMIPRRGRSSYLGARALGHVDPGAEAVAVWLGAVSHVDVGLGSS